MSMSTPGDIRRPSINKPSDKANAADGAKTEPESETAKPGTSTRGGRSGGSSANRPGGSSGSRSGTSRSAPKSAAKGHAKGAAGGKGRKPVAPVKVNQGRNWGPIALFTAAGLLAVSIIGFGAWKVIEQAQKNKVNSVAWQERAADIEGIVNFGASKPELLTPEGRKHANGVLSYDMNPPVGGTHNPVWQNCMGDVYSAEIPKEQAVHSLEHGAVWITYRPGLANDQVDRLAQRVDGVGYMLMSPYPGLDKPISLQAWGYQLKLDNADDRRIDDFISALRQNASQEEGAVCSGGITATGSRPLDLGQPQG